VSALEQDAVKKSEFRSMLVNRKYNIWKPLKDTLSAEDTEAFNREFCPPKKDPNAMRDEGSFEICGADAQRAEKPQVGDSSTWRDPELFQEQLMIVRGDNAILRAEKLEEERIRVRPKKLFEAKIRRHEARIAEDRKERERIRKEEAAKLAAEAAKQKIKDDILAQKEALARKKIEDEARRKREAEEKAKADAEEAER
jgi:hypothetical protein